MALLWVAMKRVLVMLDFFYDLDDLRLSSCVFCLLLLLFSQTESTDPLPKKQRKTELMRVLKKAQQLPRTMDDVNLAHWLV